MEIILALLLGLVVLPAANAQVLGTGQGMTSAQGDAAYVNSPTETVGQVFTGSLTASTLTVTGNAFSVGGSTLVVSGGNVGIGTTAPATKLHMSSGTLTINGTAAQVLVNATVRTNGGATLLASQNSVIAPATTGTSQPGAALRIIAEGASSQALDFGTFTGAPYGAWIQAGNGGALGSYSPIALNPNGGNVGIGTTAPVGLLSVMQPAGTAATTAALVVSSATGPMFQVLGDGSAYHSGNLGVGVSAPAGVKLAVSGYMATTGGLAGNSTSGKLSLYGDIEGSIGMTITDASFVGIGTPAPATKLQLSSGTFFGDGNVADIIMVGTPLDATTHYMRIDTLAADTAGPPAAGDCDAAAEVGRMVASSRYTATADNMLWVCLQTGAATYAWWKTALTAP